MSSATESQLSDTSSGKASVEPTFTWRESPLAHKILSEARTEAVEKGLDVCPESLEIATNLLVPDDRATSIELKCKKSPMDLRVRKHLADGWAGDVSKAIDLETKQTVVLKQFRRRKSSDQRLELWAVREVALHYGLSKSRETIMGGLTSENIVPVFCIVPGPDFFYLCMEEMMFPLAQLLDRFADEGNYLHAPEIKFVFHQIAQGLKWIHGHDVMHRDLTTNNILINVDGGVKISDFGEATRIRPRGSDKAHTPHVGTPWYCAPEILLGSDTYGPGVDIWSAGCVLAEMMLLEPLFQGDNDIQMVDLIGKVLGRPSEEDLDVLKQLAPDTIAWEEGDVYDQLPSNGTLSAKLNQYDNVTLEMVKILLTWNPETRWAGFDDRSRSELETEPERVRFRTMWHSGITRSFGRENSEYGLDNMVEFRDMRNDWLEGQNAMKSWDSP